jgi:putative transposase
MPTAIPPLTYGNFYHIYNRGNNQDNLFRKERNYAYFLDLWWKHVSPIADTWAYCLLKNHFHAVVYIKNKEDLTGLKQKSADRGVRGDKGAGLANTPGDLSGLKVPSKYFSNFFNAYARGFNIAAQRTGALFERPFKRIPIDNTKYLMQLIVYVHQNPQKHNFVEDFRQWNFSSYHMLVAKTPTRLQSDRVMESFGGTENFVRIHQEIQPLVGLEDIE